MIIFDIGASVGEFSKKYSKNSTIYAFEPNKLNLITLIDNCKNLKNYFIIDKAVSDIEGYMDFYESNYTNASSLLPFTENTKIWLNPNPTLPILKTINTYKVDTIRLDKFIEKNNINQTIDFIKIDTQGHDLKVIKSLGDHIFRVREILAEVQTTNYELYKNQTKKSELVEYMKIHDFSLKKNQQTSKNQEENIWFTNNKFYNHYNLE